MGLRREVRRRGGQEARVRMRAVWDGCRWRVQGGSWTLRSSAVGSRVGAARRWATVGLLLSWRRPAKCFQAVRLRWPGGVCCSRTAS